MVANKSTKLKAAVTIRMAMVREKESTMMGLGAMTAANTAVANVADTKKLNMKK